MWFVFYVRVVEDKLCGVKMSPIFFGGSRDNRNDAECLARACVNSARGGTIIPRIYESNRHAIFLLPEVEKKFREQEIQMRESATIANKPRTRKRK